MLPPSCNTLPDGFPPSWSDLSKQPDMWAALCDADARSANALPARSLRYEALRLSPPQSIKVVIVGNGLSAHNKRSHGLAYSVPFSLDRTSLPIVVRNFQSEMCNDMGIPSPAFCDLTSVAEQGVLLLNSIWTLDENEMPDKKLGWERVTRGVVHHVSSNAPFVVFIFVGNDTHSLASAVDSRHPVIFVSAPSSKEASRGFFGSRIFSRANALLVERGQSPVDWTRIATPRALPPPSPRDNANYFRRICSGIFR